MKEYNIPVTFTFTVNFPIREKSLEKAWIDVCQNIISGEDNLHERMAKAWEEQIIPQVVESKEKMESML